MARSNAELAKDRTGWVTGWKVRPKKTGGKQDVPSTVVFSVETANDRGIVDLLAKIARDGSAINFGLAISQAEIDFGGGE